MFQQLLLRLEGPVPNLEDFLVIAAVRDFQKPFKSWLELKETPQAGATVERQDARQLGRHKKLQQYDEAGSLGS